MDFLTPNRNPLLLWSGLRSSGEHTRLSGVSSYKECSESDTNTKRSDTLTFSPEILSPAEFLLSSIEYVNFHIAAPFSSDDFTEYSPLVFKINAASREK